MSYGRDRPASWTLCSRSDFEEWFRETGFTCLSGEQEVVEEVSCGGGRRGGGCGECYTGVHHRYGLLLCGGACAWHKGTATCRPRGQPGPGGPAGPVDPQGPGGPGGPPPSPVDGLWSVWGSWAQCSRTCGGQRSRSRTCASPLHGGRPCQGPASATEPCNTQACGGKGSGERQGSKGRVRGKGRGKGKGRRRRRGRKGFKLNIRQRPRFRRLFDPKQRY